MVQYRLNVTGVDYHLRGGRAGARSRSDTPSSVVASTTGLYPPAATRPPVAQQPSDGAAARMVLQCGAFGMALRDSRGAGQAITSGVMAALPRLRDPGLEHAMKGAT